MIYNEAAKNLDPPITDILQDVCVLFADDNQDTLDILEYCTKSLGWKGVFVRSAIEILEAVNKSSDKGQIFDAIVADVNYFQTDPNITGITAAREIRKVKPDVPIVFVSAYANSIIREEVRRVKAELIAKPVDPTVLFNMLAQLIYWHRLSLSNSYEGKDKRRASVNLSNYFRRSTDRKVSSPRIVTDSTRRKQDEG